MAMIKGQWRSIEVVCGNHSDDNNIMDLQQGPHSLFYACPKYSPDHREKGEQPCFNRINLIEFEKMLDHLADLLVDAEEKGQVPNLKNYSWDKRGITYTVLSHTNQKIVIRILNRKALMRK